jgi:hypothetical protein
MVSTELGCKQNSNIWGEHVWTIQGRERYEIGLTYQADVLIRHFSSQALCYKPKGRGFDSR